MSKPATIDLQESHGNNDRFLIKRNLESSEFSSKKQQLDYKILQQIVMAFFAAIFQFFAAIFRCFKAFFSIFHIEQRKADLRKEGDARSREKFKKLEPEITEQVSEKLLALYNSDSSQSSLDEQEPVQGIEALTESVIGSIRSKDEDTEKQKMSKAAIMKQIRVERAEEIRQKLAATLEPYRTAVEETEKRFERTAQKVAELEQQILGQATQTSDNLPSATTLSCS